MEQGNPLEDGGAKTDWCCKCWRRTNKGERSKSTPRTLAGIARIDMSRHSFAKQHGEVTRPPFEDGVELVAFLPASTGNTICAKAALSSFAHPVNKPIALLRRHTERVGKVVSAQSLADTEFENEVITSVKT